MDKTGFTQPFDFRLEWMPHGLEAAPDDGRASLFAAVQEQLGLKLNAEKDDVDVVVIDHVEPPSTN